MRKRGRRLQAESCAVVTLKVFLGRAFGKEIVARRNDEIRERCAGLARLGRSRTASDET